MDAQELMYKLSVIVKEEVCREMYEYYMEIHKLQESVSYLPDIAVISVLYDKGLKAASERMKKEIKPEDVTAMKEKVNEQ
jgi:hypothetical protein